MGLHICLFTKDTERLPARSCMLNKKLLNSNGLYGWSYRISFLLQTARRNPLEKVSVAP